VPSVPKQMKQVGGRFPAIEAKMDEWMDQQIASGLDVRDQIAREKAKTFAKEIGFPLDRFKASAKWLDKVSDHRTEAARLARRR
jgi:predicted house-cleaning NTP pyrophosphatase (Maf/HAM1 superfamily)